MNLVTHDWNGSAIAQLAETTKISKYDVPAGYVNATQMCQACGKKWAHYASLDSTKDYWNKLSTDIGIPISELVVSIKGGNNKEIQGTWTHPEIAIDLAQWVNVEFRIWANRALRQIMSGQKQSVQIVTQREPIALSPAPQDIASIIDLTLGKTDLDPKLIAGLKLNAIAKYHPAYEMLVETVKPSLSISVETELVRPTKLGEMLAETTGETWSAIKVNKLLIEQEFQVKNPDGKNPAYLPTEKGKKYGQLVLDTAKGRDKTVQSLQWHKEVLEAIEVDDH